MRILLLGSGGREHAIAWKIMQSPRLTKLWIAPGNAGTSACGENVNLSVTDLESIKKFVLSNKVEMVVVGPEDPLVKGIYDYFLNDNLLKHIHVIGPSQTGAMLEGSKDFAKAFMSRHKIPTAKYKTFNSSNLEEGYAFLESLKPPYVLKADGLAAGKGVLIINDIAEAKKELAEMIVNAKFGKAGNQVVIEEFLKGIEASVFVITDGESYKLLSNAKDYKRIGEGDTGLNTGGMGAVSPVPFVDEEFMDKVEQRVIIPTIEGFKKEKIVYKGFIYFGLINIKGEPFVIEYNVRLGDPEAEVIVPKINTDIIALFEAVGKGQLSKIKCRFDDYSTVTVVVVSGGYPGDYEKGKEISGLDSNNESIIFHAGTKKDEKTGKIVTSGGRVLTITSSGNTMKEALDISYKTISQIHFENMYFRRDIGFDL